MWVLAGLLVGVVLCLIGVGAVKGVWEAARGRPEQPEPPARDVFLQAIADCLGLDPKQLEPSTPLLLGPMADELDITELFLEIEEVFDIELPDAETQDVDTVGGLWELVERKVRARLPPDEQRRD